jgi:hypothetical protein
MEIVIDKPISMADSKIEISISGLPPGGHLILHASMCYPWAQSVMFGSTAEFIADENGCLDLSKQSPISGDYQDIDSMGFLTSMRHMSGELKTAWENISIDKCITINLIAECGTETTEIKIERLFMSPDIKTERISEPFVGAFYYSENPENKTVLMLGGSSGELINVLPVASLLASHGFNRIFRS